MKSHGLIFTGESVRGILAGRKTQTRRVLNPQPEKPQHSGMPLDHFEVVGTSPEAGLLWEAKDRRGKPSFVFPVSSYGVKASVKTLGPGDRVWVREAWARNPDFMESTETAWAVCYKADPGHEHDGLKWRSPMFMPRWACRLELEVTGVRIERLQDISGNDCIAEGAWNVEERAFGRSKEAIRAFSTLWDSINGKKAGRAWADNPWVLAIEFKRAEAEAAGSAA